MGFEHSQYVNIISQIYSKLYVHLFVVVQAASGTVVQAAKIIMIRFLIY